MAAGPAPLPGGAAFRPRPRCTQPDRVGLRAKSVGGTCTRSACPLRPPRAARPHALRAAVRTAQAVRAASEPPGGPCGAVVWRIARPQPGARLSRLRRCCAALRSAGRRAAHYFLRLGARAKPPPNMVVGGGWRSAHALRAWRSAPGRLRSASSRRPGGRLSRPPCGARKCNGAPLPGQRLRRCARAYGAGAPWAALRRGKYDRRHPVSTHNCTASIAAVQGQAALLRC